MLTIASEKGHPVLEALDRCSIIAVQTEGMRRRLVDLGIGINSLRLVYPGINLAGFTADCTRKNVRPRILFATFPREEHELQGRGVWLLLETARRYPDIHFTLVGRPWKSGNAQLVVTREIEARGLKNVRMLHGTQTHMADLYRSHAFTVIPYTEAGGGKECPRSLIESLACGAPVLISDSATFSPLVADEECGQVFSSSADSLASAIEQSLRSYSRLSMNAARVAREYFDVRRTIHAYEEIYDHALRN